MTVAMWIASAAFILLWVGFFTRRKRYFHVPLVVSGIVLDIGLVLFLQLSQSAVNTALFSQLSLAQRLHIGFSTFAVLLYFPVLWCGLRLLYRKARPVERVWHRRLGIAALSARTFGFLFMFSMLGGVQK